MSFDVWFHLRFELGIQIDAWLSLHQSDPLLEGSPNLGGVGVCLSLELLAVLHDGQQDPGESLKTNGLLLGRNFLKAVDVGLEIIGAEVVHEPVDIWLLGVGKDGLELLLPRGLDALEALNLERELFLELGDHSPHALHGVSNLSNQHV